MTDTPRTIVIRASPDGDAIGYVCIDSTVDGRARGGLRLMPDVTPEELALLARAMTLKYGFLGLPQGGAKGGVLGDPEAPPEERAARLRQFGERAASIFASREYVPDSDMGTTGGEIQAMLESAGIRVARREYRGHRSGLYTAATVFEGARAAADARGLPIASCRVAVEGYGRVGRPLAEMFARAGATVVAISTRHGGLYRSNGLNLAVIGERAGAGGDAVLGGAAPGERIAAADLKFVPVEILCPCARHDSLRAEDVEAIGAKVISSGANSPVTPRAERLLWERGIVCVPDFVANAGGVLGGTMEFAGWRPDEILAFCSARFRPRVASLIREAGQAGCPPRDVAEAFALERFANVKRLAEQASWRGSIVAGALQMHREGWVPGRLVRRLSEGYFSGRLQ